MDQTLALTTVPQLQVAMVDKVTQTPACQEGAVMSATAGDRAKHDDFTSHFSSLNEAQPSKLPNPTFLKIALILILILYSICMIHFCRYL